MPVEIKELIIKAEFRNPEESPAPASSPAPDSSDATALIEECVRQVLIVLDRRNER